MGEIKFVGALLMIALFSIAVISFMVDFASDNSAKVSLANDTRFNQAQTELKGNLSEWQTRTNQSSASFFPSEITTGDETTRTGGQFKIGMSSLISTASTIISASFLTIFGNDIGFGILLTALSSFLVFVAVRYLWQTWKGGAP